MADCSKMKRRRRAQSLGANAPHATAARACKRLRARLGALAIVAFVALSSLAQADEPRTYVVDPFAQATTGAPNCPAVTAPALTEYQMRIQAHERAERGTSCCLAGTCECGGAYKRDPEINARVVAALKARADLSNTSIWVTTMRKFVTLQGCARTLAQKREIERLVKRQPDVAVVWNEIHIVPVRQAPARAK
jgi:BON domain